MKSYLLPAIIGASVIAVATLIYALMLPSTPLNGEQIAVPQNKVIVAPSDAPQTSVTPPQDEVDAFKLVIDIARVQADGMAVFAGRGAPNGTIFIIKNGTIFAQNTIDDQGQWVVLPEEPLAPGSHLLRLEMVSIDGTTERADVSLVVQIAQNGDEKPLVALVPQTDDQSPVLLQSPDEATKDVTDEVSNEASDKAAPASQAEQVAEILGQDDIFIQIGSLSWNDKTSFSVHGVASGGDRVSGEIAGLPLETVPLASSGRWTSKVIGDPFGDADRQMLTVTLLDDENQVLAQTQLNVARSQLTAGLDGSLMVVVHKGDALWRIAYRSYGEGVRYVDIFRRNADQIDDPDLIYPNQIFAVPGVKSQ